VQLIRSALSIGFSVNDLAGIFRDLAAEKLLALEARLRDLRSWRRTLRDTLAGWDSVLAKTPRHKPGRLLEALLPLTRSAALGVLLWLYCLAAIQTPSVRISPLTPAESALCFHRFAHSSISRTRTNPTFAVARDFW
jgi:hypothetical protein